MPKQAPVLSEWQNLSYFLLLSSLPNFSCAPNEVTAHTSSVRHTLLAHRFTSECNILRADEWREKVRQTCLQKAGLSCNLLTVKHDKKITPVTWNEIRELGTLYVKNHGFFVRLAMMLLSAPLATLPVLGDLLYIWLHGGLRARTMMRYFARTRSEWSSLEKSRYVTSQWKTLRVFGMWREITELIPVIGVLFILLNDVALYLYMVDRISVSQLRDITLPSVQHTMPYLLSEENTPASVLTPAKKFSRGTDTTAEVDE